MHGNEYLSLPPLPPPPSLRDFSSWPQISEGNSRLKHEWLTDQTQLVSCAVETERLAEKVMLFNFVFHFFFFLWLGEILSASMLESTLWPLIASSHCHDLSNYSSYVTYLTVGLTCLTLVMTCLTLVLTRLLSKFGMVHKIYWGIFWVN